MPLRRILTKLNLLYADPLEEQEYSQIKLPLVKGFFKTLFIAFTAILIPYAVRYFIKDIFPQNFAVIALIVFGIIIFFIQHKLEKYLEYLFVGYLMVVICMFATVFRVLVSEENTRECFYMGYAFAMIHRLVGYRVLKFKHMAWLYIVSISVKFPLIPNPDAVLNIIVIFLDILTVCLSFKSEKDERSLFDCLYKSKKDILKFKELLTKYLPNQMVIFANDYSCPHYMNNAFKKTFKCQKPQQIKEVLDKLVVEHETFEKNKILFNNLKFYATDEDQLLSLSGLMTLVTQNIEVLRDLGVISIPVIEYETSKNDSLQVYDAQLKQRLDNKEDCSGKNNDTDGRSMRTNYIVPLKPSKDSSENKKEISYGPVDANDSLKSGDKGSSKSISSDMAYEEGRKRVFRVKIFPLLWDDNEAIAMIFDDITQQRIIMELKVADKNKDLVIAMVSHELRTPLNGMLGLIDIAKKNISDHNVLFYLSACRDSGMLLLNLVNSILDMNQIKNKKLRLVYTPLNLEELLKEVKMLFNQTCRIKSLYLKVEIGPNVPRTIITDKNRLSQILINLVGNAFKFTFKGGVTVRVDLERLNPCVVKFSVEDTGIGIKKEDQDKLFQMYGRLDQQDKKINTNGIGLGLTISNSLALLLNPIGNQRIQVKSEEEKGTCFSFMVESQSVEALGKLDPSAGEISSLALIEDKDTTVLKKMLVYSTNNNENFTKMTSSQNVDSRRCLLSGKEKRRTEPDKAGESSPSFEEKRGYKRREDNQSKVEIDELIMKMESSNKEARYVEMRDEEKEDMEEEEEEKEEKGYSRPWCLIVDDNPFNLMVACHIMEEKGFQVKTALNGKEAIAKARDHHLKRKTFKVVLMDCQMPVMDGYEATRVMRQMMKQREIGEYPIIALTANNRDDEHEKLCKEVGMSGNVAKPLKIEELEIVLKFVQREREKSVGK